MFEQLGNNTGNIVTLKIRGEISEKDFEKISNILDEVIKKYQTVRLLIMVEHYASWSSEEALYEDLKFAKIYSGNIDRMAVVGDRSWKSTWVALFGLFSGFLTNYYDKSELKEAWNWLRQP